MRSIYGTTGIRKSSEGEIIHRSIDKTVIVLLVYVSLVLDNILLTVVGKIIQVSTFERCDIEAFSSAHNSHLFTRKQSE